MGFAASSPVESTGRRAAQFEGRPTFVGRLRTKSQLAEADEVDDPVSPGSPPLISLAGAYQPSLKGKHQPGDPQVPGTMGTFFHNGYGHGFVSVQPSLTRDSMRSPPRVMVPPLQTNSSPRQSEKHTPPPTTATTGVSVAPSTMIDDPRDHSVLESIYISLHETRMINLRPLLIIPSYLSSFFGQLKTHPPLIFLAPDRKLDGPGIAGGRDDAGEGTPFVHGVVDNLAARAFGARAMGWQLPAPVPIGNESVMPNSAETLAKSALQQQSPTSSTEPSLAEPTMSLSPGRARTRQRGQSLATSRSRSSTGAGAGDRSPSTVGGAQRATEMFVEDYLAVDITRPLKRVELEGNETRGSIGTITTLPQRYFEYDVGHAGILLKIELANVLACVEDMWEHAKSLDPEAQRPVFDGKVQQYVT